MASTIVPTEGRRSCWSSVGPGRIQNHGPDHPLNQATRVCLPHPPTPTPWRLTAVLVRAPLGLGTPGSALTQWVHQRVCTQPSIAAARRGGFSLRGRRRDSARMSAFVPDSFLLPQLGMLNLMECSEPLRRNHHLTTNKICMH